MPSLTALTGSRWPSEVATPCDTMPDNDEYKLWDKGYCYTGEPYDKPFLGALCQRHGEYRMELRSPRDTFTTKYLKVKNHFDVETNHHQYHTDRTSMTFNTVMNDATMQGKPKTEVLTALLDKLQLCQRALGPLFAVTCLYALTPNAQSLVFRTSKWLYSSLALHLRHLDRNSDQLSSVRKRHTTPLDHIPHKRAQCQNTEVLLTLGVTRDR
jgi:hypothetical protein